MAIGVGDAISRAQLQQAQMRQQIGWTDGTSLPTQFTWADGTSLRNQCIHLETVQQVSKPKEKKKMGIVRQYVDKHRDIIFTLGVAILVDHFVLNGALRIRIQRVVEAVLTKIEKSLGVIEQKAVGDLK